MIYANCRRRIPLIGAMTWGKVRWSGTLSNSTGTRTMLFVHGIRETEARLKAVYSEILSRAVASHDDGVGFIWPGGSTLPLWPITVATAVVPSAQALRDVILAVGPKYGWLDINCHSLGCAVTMQALLQAGNPGQYIRNIYMMAPAMARNLEDYYYPLRHNQTRVHVCYSRLDPALLSYRLWPPSNLVLPPLGFYGPRSEDRAALPGLLYGHDYTGLIGHTHGGYRMVSAYYQMLLLGREG